MATDILDETENLSVLNPGNVALPTAVETLHLFLDGDKPGSRAARAAAQAAVTQMNASRQVQINRVPIGKDRNDVLREGVGIGVITDE